MIKQSPPASFPQDPVSRPDQGLLRGSDGCLQSVHGYTWPGIEFGEPPGPRHSFFEYLDALRLGDLELFKFIEAESGAWWSPTLDRGAGAALHIAVDHGRLACVRYLVEERGVYVNQQDLARGWTPLVRCARMAHYTHAPYLQIFEYLLQQGADPDLAVTLEAPNQILGQAGSSLTILDVAVDKGRGWQPGQVKALLATHIDKYKHVPKQPAFVYNGECIGEEAASIMKRWAALPHVLPPENWQPPPPAGFAAAQGMRKVVDEPWRPAGDRDGSFYMRPMTDKELAEQAHQIAS